MHVVMFGDQHVESAGGAQVSMRLQRRFLERAGHTVTVVAPRMWAPHPSDSGYVDVPSIPITLDREYALSVPGRRADRFVDAALAGRPPVDIVHIQADFWGAALGYRFAARHDLPVVHTLHNRVDVGVRATLPFPGLALTAMTAWLRRALPAPRVGRIRTSSPDPDAAATSARIRRRPPHRRAADSDEWEYLRVLAAGADAVTAPSGHFARRLEAQGAAAAVDVVWNGMDDDVLDAALAAGRADRLPGRPRLVWLGRFSPEKRLLPFLEAVAVSGIDADVEVIGAGGQERAARRLVARRRPAASVVFAGRVPYAEALRRIGAADAVVQTSIGFETQGMTVFEAAALGTPSVVADPDIAGELRGGVWTVADATTSALAETLRGAAGDIAAGTAPRPDARMAELFRQSSRTAAMLAVYERVLAAR